jgi:hypothetical protein
LFLAFCFVPAILERGREIDLVAVGSFLFGIGALAVSVGLYVKASALRSAAGATDLSLNRRIHGGCELCATESPVVHCKVHQLHLCGNCLAKHYDFRSCAYVPSSRGVANKTAKARAARAF